MSPLPPSREPLENQSHSQNQLSPILSSLFPPGVVAVEQRQPGDPIELWPVEQASMVRCVAKRVQEFAAGRSCARRALAEFGLRSEALPVGTDRRPVWPNNMLGSITHTDDFCAAVVAERQRFDSIGIDAEVVGRVTAELWPTICTNTEIARLADLALADQQRVATLIFAAKEAFYKCQYELTGQWLEFLDIALDIAGWDLGSGIFAIRPLAAIDLQRHRPHPWLGRFHFEDGLVFAGMAFAKGDQ